MKFQIMPQELLRHISIAQRAISNRTTMNILECIRFEAQDNRLVLTSTDLELAIVTSVDCTVSQPGVAVIPSVIIGNIFRKLPQAQATVHFKDGAVSITCGSAHFHLQVPNADEYPMPPEILSEQRTHLPNDVLKRAISETEFATSLDESKVALTGIYLERRSDSIQLVALDGYRLAVRSIALGAEETAFETSMIIPKRAMNELVKILSDSENTTVYSAKGHIVFESGTTKLFSRLIEKNYIDYKDIISSEHSCSVEVERAVLQSALERASLLAKEERANLIKLNFESDRITIESNSEIGHVSEQIASHHQGDAVKIAFNAKYLLDGVRALDCDAIRLNLNGTLNPMIIRPVGEDNYTYLVLPVRVGRE